MSEKPKAKAEPPKRPVVVPMEPITGRSPFVRICAHGDPGSGKTEFARSIIEPAPERVAFISAEAGWGVLSDFKDSLRRFELFSEEDSAALEGKDERLLKVSGEIGRKVLINFRRAYEYIRLHSADFDWWVMDGRTRMSRALLAFALRKYGDADGEVPAENRFVMWADIATKEAAINTLLCSLPMNGYINTLTEVEEEFRKFDVQEGNIVRTKERRTGRSKRSPALSGRKAVAQFDELWDAVIHLYAEDELTGQRSGGKPEKRRVFYAITAGGEKVSAKIRVPQAPPVPRLLRLGTVEADGTRTFVGGSDWDLRRLSEAMRGEVA